MKRRVTNISVHRSSLTVAATYAIVIFIIGVVSIPMIFVFGFTSGMRTEPSLMLVLIGVIIAYAIFGTILSYLFTALMAFIYNNVISGWTGGVEFTLTEPE